MNYADNIQDMIKIMNNLDDLHSSLLFGDLYDTAGTPGGDFTVFALQLSKAANHIQLAEMELRHALLAYEVGGKE